LEQAYTYDYSQLLPIFIYPDEQQSQQMYPDMDKVIDKCSQVIERHSMYLSRKEHVKWIDDSYFLIGKARFYKQQYELAEETFLYVYQAYKKNPERYHGLNWLIKTYIEMREWDKAEEFLDIAEDEKRKIPDPIWGEINATYAQFHLAKDKDLEKLVEKLEIAIRLVEDKDDKRRYTFILAQINQERANYSLATQYYTQVLKMKPDYTMRFNAKIRRAISLDISASNADAIKKEMKKMLRDKKNEEFRDQIYYALAEISLKEDDEPQAIDYLKKSVKFSVSNQKQKALSYLKLADIHFEQPNYIKAQLFYDSTLIYLPEEHPEYYAADEKNASLQDLVKNLKIIQRQDSLIQLAGLSEKEREKKVKEIIKELKAEEERKKQAKLRELQIAQAEREQGAIVQNRNSGRKGEWYFYNPTTLALGRNEFKRIWGDRQLADNWRRNEALSTPGQQTQSVVEQKEGSLPSNEEDQTRYKPETYLQEIPTGMEDLLAAHGKVIEALFNVGTIFKESFEDYKNAEEAFKRITQEYDTSRFNLPAHYQLYRLYLLVDDEAKAAVEKEWVLSNHPFSEYAYLIKNPDYNKETKESREKVEDFYESTYRLYTYELYADVIESCNKAESVFPINHLKPQFDFLKAKSIGYISSKEEFKAALEDVVADHPGTEVKEQAEEILKLMEESKSAVPASAKPPYVHDPGEKHIYVMSIPNRSAKSNELKIKLSNFNQEFFREANLDFTTTTVKGRKLFLIRTFPNEKEAMRYLRAIRNQLEIALQLKQEGGRDYLISTENFKLLFKSKDEEQYLEFFLKEYPS
jgi:TolA-binding protein